MKKIRMGLLIGMQMCIVTLVPVMAGKENIDFPTLDEVRAVFITNRTVFAVEKAFSRLEGRLMPYWTQEPYKSDRRIDRMKYELEMEHRIMSQNVDTSSAQSVFASFKAKIRLARALGWFANCPTNRTLFMSMAYHVRRDYSNDKADTIRDFWLAEWKVNPRLLPYGTGSNARSNIMRNAEILRSHIMRYREEVLDLSSLWARQFRGYATDEEYQSTKEEFTKIAGLTPEEVKRVFGSLPESCGGTSGGFVETHVRDWRPDVEGMYDLFETSVRDVISQSGKDPYIEHDFYEHILGLPVCTNMPHFASLMEKKKELLKKAQDRLEYCKTNETAYLQLAVHLGSLVEIPTNTWYAEGIRARIQDTREQDISLIKRGLPPVRKRNRYLPIPAGKYLMAWELKWRMVHRWNRAVQDYRRGVLADLRETLLKNESRLDKEEARNFRCLFPRAARLTKEEEEFVFGSPPKSDGKATSGSMTNAVSDRITLPPAP